MDRPKIIRLWGKADNLDIEFKNEGGIWKVNIPPDLTDGAYAVHLTAVNENGECSYWVGELYMADGVCHFKISELLYRTQLKAKEYKSIFCKSKIDTVHSCFLYEVGFAKKHTAHMKKRKQSNSDYSASFAVNFEKTESVARYAFSFKTKELTVKPKTIYHSHCTIKTENSIRKGCSCYGNG